MNGSASVHSLQALYDWHAALVIFRTEALESLASISLEIQRAQSWLDDQLRFWQMEARDADEEVAQRKQELSSRKFPDFSGRIPDCSVQEENLWLAEKRLERARDQIDTVHSWFHRLPKMVNEEYEGAARHLTNMLEGDLPRGLAILKSQMASLEAYLNIRLEQPQAAAPDAKPAAPAAPKPGAPADTKPAAAALAPDAAAATLTADAKKEPS
jgi:hypothetical protein